MSETETMLHVLRMPVDLEDRSAPVTPLQHYAFITLVVCFGTLIMLGFLRWL